MQRSWMDLKFAARMLWRNPWSTAAAAVTLALGVGARDPLVFGGLTVLVASVALGATFLPAHRATHISPVTALRSE